MPTVTCPSCGERGKIPATLLGTRIKCRKCGNAFNVAPASNKPVEGEVSGQAMAPAVAAAQSSAAAQSTSGAFEGIAVEGLDSTAWTVTAERSPEAGAAPTPGIRPEGDGHHHFAAEGVAVKEYKLLMQKDRFFEGKFDLSRLEEALNYYAHQGWVVKAFSTPHVKGFSGGLQEEIVVLLER